MKAEVGEVEAWCDDAADKDRLAARWRGGLPGPAGDEDLRLM
jgi:hypothetical protein